VPAIDLDGSKRDEIGPVDGGNHPIRLWHDKRNDVRGNIFEPRLDLGSGFPDKYFFGRSDYNYS